MNKRIYVGNLATSSTETFVGELFSKHGHVKSCRLVNDRVSGLFRGFGFVEMSTEDEASAAVTSLNGYEVNGRRLHVNEARERQSAMESPQETESVVYRSWRRDGTTIDGSRGLY